MQAKIIRQGAGALAALALVAATAIAAPAIADPTHPAPTPAPPAPTPTPTPGGGGGTGGGGGGSTGGGGAATSRTVTTLLNGRKIPGGAGDLGARGSARFTLSPDEESVCFEITWRGLDGVVTAAHIHRAPRGQTGPHHIDLFDDEHLVGRRNQVAACVQVEGGHGHGGGGMPAQMIQEVIQTPGDFYLNVHTTAFPAGAIRGQLATSRGRASAPRTSSANPR
jgi:hypothetical protein